MPRPIWGRAILVFGASLSVGGCDRLTAPPTALLHECAAIAEPVGSAELAVPLDVYERGWRADGALRWHHSSDEGWVAHWRWRDDDTGKHHRATFAVAEDHQTASTLGCGPHLAAITRVTLDGEDLSVPARDEAVYDLRDRFTSEQGVALGKVRPRPKPTTEGPAGHSWGESVDVAPETNTIPIDIPFDGVIDGYGLHAGQIVCPLLAQGFELHAEFREPETMMEFTNGFHEFGVTLSQRASGNNRHLELSEPTVGRRMATEDQIRPFLRATAWAPAPYGHVCIRR